ncbi:capsular associated protein, putative [Trichophyton verrucosum HKI 0517]|uniref:Capsular associated protein, putative n=1 Tax=Trichophyton verrucosum (strain HKI 0517) TaxID=663202 RepID=D4CZB1_TRIVH|nr:capsular associated protein, putative [Trichophyton verrucosum HKI 0517]EFE45062.1 capsular associated protein, putative [Trichophyton verrucosum HKI 0517]
MPVSHSFHRRLLFLTSGAFVLLFIYYFGTVYRHRLGVVPKHGSTVHEEPEEIEEICMGNDPIKALSDKADNAWRKYDSSRSMTFSDAVVEYRVRYGRHPPPGFKEWYIFARENDVRNVDDFDQINDDLRPFWSAEPKTIRRRVAAACQDHSGNSIAAIHIRDGAIANITGDGWRIDTLKSLVARFAQKLPDMDIAMNTLDQPRLVTKWEDMQAMLNKEIASRVTPPDATYSFTKNMEGFFSLTSKNNVTEEDKVKWAGIPSKQYMEIAATACPPESPARNPILSIQEADSRYKIPGAGLVSNFNTSSDLCVVGPAIKNLHGFLFSSSSISHSDALIPIFSECKVNINNDILFPANMYWKDDERYTYNGAEDIDWKMKNETLFWRGATSGGIQTADNWSRMHRQRLEFKMNGTKLIGKTERVLPCNDQSLSSGDSASSNFQPTDFANKHFDFGFTDPMACVPANCEFYNDTYTYKEKIPLSHQFVNKYLVDIDGHSFSGRWRAFLLSKSLGIKATIFREWHDSRLFAWRHFVPLDNRYDDFYALMTYFIGTGTNNTTSSNPHVARHDKTAQNLARQGREWAEKVLRNEDIEAYMYRLLLEYGRVIDDNRDSIGYHGDGSELKEFDEHLTR